METYGEILRGRLEVLGVTQSRLAKEARLTPATITNVINGKKPHRRTQENIQRALDRFEKRANKKTNLGSPMSAANSRECLLQVKGAFEYPASKCDGGWILEKAKKGAFWANVGKSDARLPEKKGVYVFAIRTAAGYIPLYVGKTRLNFKTECFNSANWGKYYEGLVHRAEGTPVMFLIHLPQRKGAPNSTAIDEVETFLIQLASFKNPRLVNIQVNRRKWSIEGLNEHRRTEESEATHALRNCLGLAQ